MPKHKCKQCKATFSCVGQLNRHMRYHTAPTFKCETCGHFYFQQADLRTHIWRIHHNGFYHCAKCNTAFASRSSCDDHLCVSKNRKCQRGMALVGSIVPGLKVASSAAARRATAAQKRLAEAEAELAATAADDDDSGSAEF